MKKLLVLGMVIGLAMLSVAVYAEDITYCQGHSLSDKDYSLTEDIYFNNASLGVYANRCFGCTNNVTVNMMGFTIYPNFTDTAVAFTYSNNCTFINGTINFTFHAQAGTRGIQGNGDNVWLENIVLEGANIGYQGLHAGGVANENLTVINLTFTNFVHNDFELHIAQSEITSCGNSWNTFWGAGSVLSKDSCSEPAASYKDYIRQVNCTAHSSSSVGSLVCSNEIKIPADCVNITTEAWTVVTPQNETWLNENTSFTRFTCNPEGDRIEHCDNLYKTCTYYNFNSYPTRRWDDYAAGGNATSWHVIAIPMVCIENVEGGNFSMIGRLQLSCKSFTESGIEIDGESEDCEHGMYCFNSNTMEERFTDCTSILTPCPFGCVEGVCLSVATTTLPRAEDQQSLIDLTPYGVGSWVSMLFTPFTIITMMLVGIGAYFEQQVDDAKGAIFLAVIIIGVLGFTYLGLYPAWIGILIAIVCAGILAKFVLKVI